MNFFDKSAKHDVEEEIDINKHGEKAFDNASAFKYQADNAP